MSSSPREWFSTTHWSTVLTASERDSARATEALERLCSTYWYPLYAHVRQRGHAVPEAEDLTQAFFAKFLAKDYLARMRPEKGRFRFYLLTALNHFLADEWDRQTRQKRGGGKPAISIDCLVGEARYRHELAHGNSPDALYERRWAVALLNQVLGQLAQEYERGGRSELFRHLKRFLVEDPKEISYPKTAAALGMTNGTLRVTVHRFRRRYGELFRAEVAGTVASADDVDAEMRDLLAALNG